MRPLLLATALWALCLVLAAGAGAARRGGGADPAGSVPDPLAWTAYGGNTQLTGFSELSAVSPDDARTFGVEWAAQLDGGVVASPLVDDGRAYVATEAGSVYALDLVTGALLWRRTFGTQVPDGGCGSYGISGTGAIDTKRGLLYVISADGQLQALNLDDGTTAPGWPLTLTTRPDVEYAWGGLQIVNDQLYVPFASYCDDVDDQGNAGDGRVVAVDLTGPTVDAVFDTVPGPDNLGGVWGYGGISAEPDGSAIYTAVGNSWVTDPATGALFDAAGYGDSVVRLTAGLVPVSSDRPATIPTAGDYDFGAAPVLFQPDGCPPLAAANNKDGLLYVWNRDNLAAGPILAEGIGTVSAPFVGAPSWSPRRQLLFDASAAVIKNGTNVGDGVTAYRVGPGCTFDRIWSTVTGIGTQPPPLVLGDVLFADGGYSGGFKALDVTTGAVLFSFETKAATFAGPAAAGNLVLTADFDGVVRAFGPSYLGAGSATVLSYP
ncbi:MAG: outer membrane protein assembly factor BamB family protein [Gaiellaceae bacterium]